MRECLQDVIMPALLASVEPEEQGEDLVISLKSLRKVRSLAADGWPDALIVRTLPNDDRKLSRAYDGNSIPPYFTTEAMEYIVECGFKHLLVDMPSIDRLFDEGKLSNHRIFWNVEQGSFEINNDTRVNNTITELIYVPNDIEDGEYLLNLQIAPFASDATPSRPLLFRATDLACGTS